MNFKFYAIEEVRKMKLTIEGTPNEIKNVLQAISGSEEHEKTSELLDNKNNQENIPNPY